MALSATEISLLQAIVTAVNELLAAQKGTQAPEAINQAPNLNTLMSQVASGR